MINEIESGAQDTIIGICMRITNNPRDLLNLFNYLFHWYMMLKHNSVIISSDATELGYKNEFNLSTEQVPFLQQILITDK